MNLTRLAGNAPLKRQLELETARRGLSHAYILSGPAGSGKRTLAGLLAAALVCDRRGGALPCLSCAGCRKAEGGIHPDIVRVGDDGKDISVAQVRALRADAYIRPNEAERKVYILENAQTMNASAQNAMLKLLEEGPAYAAFLLLTDNAAALLPTVRSRCEHLPLSPVTQREAELWLDEHYPDQPQAARQAAADRCEGLLGRAAAELEGQAAGEGDVDAVVLVQLQAEQVLIKRPGGMKIRHGQHNAGISHQGHSCSRLRKAGGGAVFPHYTTGRRGDQAEAGGPAGKGRKPPCKRGRFRI